MTDMTLEKRFDQIAEGIGTVAANGSTSGVVAELVQIHRAAAIRERDRLMEICRNAHDRLLRGDTDRELLDMLAEAWDLPPND